MKKFDYESLKDRLNTRLKLPEEYKFLEDIDFEKLSFLRTEYEYVDEYIVHMDKSTLIKK